MPAPPKAPTTVHSTLGQRARANSLDLAYDEFSPTQPHSGDPLFLVMGIGAQRFFWPEGLCHALVRRGFHVIRFDNRDVGESSRVDDSSTPRVLETLAALSAGRPIPAPYTLDHMADDTAALIEALGFESAHVCGASMGGMIAQTLAIRHPGHIRSLVSIMSHTGNPGLPAADPETMSVLVAPVPTDAQEYAEHAVGVWRTLAGPGFDFDAEAVRRRARLAFEGGVSPRGFARQLAAILAHGDRRATLREVDLPTLVIHGDADRLIPPEGGIDTADVVPGAELMIVEGMGHDLPEGVWERIADGVRRTADRADS